MENNIIVDPQLLGQAVKQLMREVGIRAKSSVSSVSGQGALVVRVIEVPKMSESELAETMKWEVERHVPFATDEVIMDFQPIERPDEPPDAQNMEVLLAVAQQDMIDRHVEMLFAAGLSPRAIDVEPLACARALIELGPDPYGRKTVAIINIGASNTDIGVFRDGLLAFPRTIPLAGDAFTQAIAEYFGIAKEQAEEWKRQYAEVMLEQIAPQIPAVEEAFFDFSAPETVEEEAPSAPDTDRTQEESAPDTERTEESAYVEAPQEATPSPSVPAPVPAGEDIKTQVFAAMAPVLSELVMELRRSLEYYRGRSIDGVIDEILLCGGSAVIKNLDQFLASELGIPTRVADPFQYAPVTSRTLMREQAPSFAVAVGLGARDMVNVPVLAGSGGKRGKK
jgi:type IV pilus assembly protein PilM